MWGREVCASVSRVWELGWRWRGIERREWGRGKLLAGRSRLGGDGEVGGVKGGRL